MRRTNFDPTAKQHFLLKMIFGILEILCCNILSLVFGIVALVHNANAKRAYEMNDPQNLQKHSVRATRFLIAGCVTFVLGLILFAVCLPTIEEQVFSSINSSGASLDTVDSWDDVWRYLTESESSDRAEKENKKEALKDSNASMDEEYLKQIQNSTPGWKNEDAGHLTEGSFKLNDTSFQLPCAFSEMEAAGFHMDEDDNNYELDANDYYVGYLYDKNNEMIGSVYLTNETDQTRKMHECSLTGVSFTTDYQNSGATFSFADGLGFGSTQKEVEKVFGEPGDTYTPGGDDNNYQMLTWYGEKYEDNLYDSLSLSFADGKVSSVTLMYIGK